MSDRATMTDGVSDTAPLRAEVVAALKKVPLLASLAASDFACLAGARELHLQTGEYICKQGQLCNCFYILLSGSVKVSQMAEGREMPLHVIGQGYTFGEVTLLANIPCAADLRAQEPSDLLELNEERFWHLMTACPDVRRAILGNMAMRFQKMQSVTRQQEKMAALGVMAAGLMHELNNPGAAARRAASQLRENLMRMHTLAAKFTETDLSRDQKQCMIALQTQALAVDQPLRMNSLEQSDAEEALAAWMEEAHIENAWKLAPTLVAVGIDSSELECAKSRFAEDTFNDALSWLEAMVSSQQLVGTIEESIGRVSDLVKAVKSYAYEGKGQRQQIDINESVHATVVILLHKIREKQIVMEKSFGAGMPPLESECSGLNQIWTNLLDNAIDAVPQGGRIGIRTWPETVDENGRQRIDLCVSVRDNGSGIPLESQQHIFEPFYTTKPAGVGTGLGLGIVFRIVEQYGGTIRFTSEPGNTEFMVRIPSKR
jgi:signal transduction histidine kinase